jgi:hypothetical protein
MAHDHTRMSESQPQAGDNNPPPPNIYEEVIIKSL